MKYDGQIRHKISQVRFRHLKRELRTGLSRRPCNCVHNGVMVAPTLKVHLCVLVNPSGENEVCDERMGGLGKSQGCPLFQCKHTQVGIRDEFVNFVTHATRAEIAGRYPDLAALLWVLDSDIPDPDTNQNVSPRSSAGVPSWVRIRIPGESLYSEPAGRGAWWRGRNLLWHL